MFTQRTTFSSNRWDKGRIHAQDDLQRCGPAVKILRSKFKIKKKIIFKKSVWLELGHEVYCLFWTWVWCYFVDLYRYCMQRWNIKNIWTFYLCNQSKSKILTIRASYIAPNFINFTENLPNKIPFRKPKSYPDQKYVSNMISLIRDVGKYQILNKPQPQC